MASVEELISALCQKIQDGQLTERDVNDKLNDALEKISGDRKKLLVLNKSFGYFELSLCFNDFLSKEGIELCDHERDRIADLIVPFGKYYLEEVDTKLRDLLLSFPKDFFVQAQGTVNRLRDDLSNVQRIREGLEAQIESKYIEENLPELISALSQIEERLGSKENFKKFLDLTMVKKKPKKQRWQMEDDEKEEDDEREENRGYRGLFSGQVLRILLQMPEVPRIPVEQQKEEELPYQAIGLWAVTSYKSRCNLKIVEIPWFHSWSIRDYDGQEYLS